MGDLARGADQRRGPREWAPLDEGRARELLRDVVSGLAYLHAHGVVHQDLKPDNVLQVVRGVRVTGLDKAPELNGKTGTLFQRNEEKARYYVRLPEGKNLALKGNNVVLPRGTRVCMTGLVKAAHLNGLMGAHPKTGVEYNVKERIDEVSAKLETFLGSISKELQLTRSVIEKTYLQPSSTVPPYQPYHLSEETSPQQESSTAPI